MQWWPLSVCLSVCPVPDPTSRTEGRSKLKIDSRKLITRVTVTPFRGQKVKRSKIKVSRPINAETENAPYIRNLVHGWSTMTRITDMRSDLKDQGYNIMSSVWRVCPWLDKESRRITKIGRKVVHDKMTLHTSSKVKDQRSRLRDG